MTADVLVVGTGLIGTSLGLALQGVRDVALADADPAVLARAVARGAGRPLDAGESGAARRAVHAAAGPGRRAPGRAARPPGRRRHARRERPGVTAAGGRAGRVRPRAAVRRPPDGRPRGVRSRGGGGGAVRRPAVVRVPRTADHRASAVEAVRQLAVERRRDAGPHHAGAPRRDRRPGQPPAPGRRQRPGRAAAAAPRRRRARPGPGWSTRRGWPAARLRCGTTCCRPTPRTWPRCCGRPRGTCSPSPTGSPTRGTSPPPTTCCCGAAAGGRSCR